MIFYVPVTPNPAGTPTFVLAPEVTVGWRFRVPGSDYSAGVLRRMPRSIAVVPGCWFLDLVESLRGHVRTKRLSATDAKQFLADLSSFRIWVDDETPLRAWNETFDLARVRRVSADRAAYLELALRFNLPLATTDATLLRVATVAAVPIFTP